MSTVVRFLDRLQTRRPTIQPTMSMLRGALMVTETAVADGLPMPPTVDVDATGVGLIFSGPDAAGMDAWATWLDVRVEVHPVSDGIATYTADAVVMEVPVHLMRLELSLPFDGEGSL